MVRKHLHTSIYTHSPSPDAALLGDLAFVRTILGHVGGKQGTLTLSPRLLYSVPVNV